MMKKFGVSFFLVLFMILPSCTFKPNYAPTDLNGYVIDMLTTKTVEDESAKSREVYRYRFAEKTYKATSASDSPFEGNYRYTLINPQQAHLVCTLQQDKNETNKMTLNFQDTDSGTWISLNNNDTPGEQGGTFIIVEKEGGGN